MKKKPYLAWLLSLCICLSMIPTAMAAGTEIKVMPPGQLPAVGETVTVEVAITGNPGIAAAQFTLAYDTVVLECTAAEVGSVLQGTLAATNTEALSGAAVVAASSTEKMGDGTLATFTFRVIGRGDPGFSLVNTQLYNEAGKELPYTVSGAPEETVTPVKPPISEGSGEEDEQAEPLFADIDEHPYESYIEEAVERGLFQGYANGTFAPENSVTRGAFVTVLWRMAGKPMPNQKTPFTDIGKVSTEFQLAIAWAYENGLINGRTATTFAPADPVSRQAALKILLQYSGGVSNVNPLYLQLYQDGFKDCAGKPDWVQNAMFWGYYNRMIDSDVNDALHPAVAATRAQLAKMFVVYTERFSD